MLMPRGGGGGRGGVQQQPVSQCRDSVSKGLHSLLPSFLPSFLASILRCSRVAATSSIWRIRDARIGFSLRPFRVSSKDFVPRLRETREIHPACKTLFPSTRMTNAREKRGRAGGDATRVTGSNFRHDLADYNRAPPPPPSFPSPSPLSRGKPSVLRHSRLTTARAGN